MTDTFVEKKIWEEDFCSYIIELAKMKTWAEGYAYGDGIRSCKNTELHDPEITQPVYDFVLDNNIWDFELLAYAPSVQILRYDPGDFYLRHTDWSLNNNRARKLTISIQLSGTLDYDGCDLLIHDGPHEPWIAHRSAGMATLFPSWTLHEVDKCTSGERWVAVAWFLGPQGYR